MHSCYLHCFFPHCTLETANRETYTTAFYSIVAASFRNHLRSIGLMHTPLKPLAFSPTQIMLHFKLQDRHLLHFLVHYHHLPTLRALPVQSEELRGSNNRSWESAEVKHLIEAYRNSLEELNSARSSKAKKKHLALYTQRLQAIV